MEEVRGGTAHLATLTTSNNNNNNNNMASLVSSSLSLSCIQYIPSLISEGLYKQSEVETLNLMGKSEIRNCNINRLELSIVKHRGERIVISLIIFEQ